MDTHRRVLLVGDTLVLGALRAVLSAQTELEVVTLGSSASQEDVRAAQAATIICDGSPDSLDPLLSITREAPGGLLIAVDPGSDYLLLVSNRQQRSLGLHDLLELIGSSEAQTPERDRTRNRPGERT